MDLNKRISRHFADSAQVKLDAVKLLTEPLRIAAERMVQCLMNEGKILACGNGGSAADAQHFSAEMLGRFERERMGLPAIALTASVQASAADFILTDTGGTVSSTGLDPSGVGNDFEGALLDALAGRPRVRVGRQHVTLEINAWRDLQDGQPR